jgi:hypothetical protein
MKRLLLAVLFMASKALGAIAVDSAPGPSYASGPAKSLTFAHTTAGSDRLMSLHFVAFVTPDSGSPTATYNGDSLTLDRSVRVTAFAQYSWIWHLVAPDTGTNNVVVGHTNSNGTLFARSVTWTGVDQATPIDAAEGATGTSTTPSKTYTSATGDMVFDTLMAGNWVEIAVTGGQTQIAEDNAGTGGSANKEVSGCSYEAGDTSTVCSWSMDSSQQWFEQGYSINPAAEDPPAPAGSPADAPGGVWDGLNRWYRP